jgi:acetylornithine/succinyldiaminopimelate/putrescine aminotransferase
MNDKYDLYNAIEKNKDVCAILYEPIQGEGGINPIFQDFFDAMFEVKQNYPKILLMADEIQIGLGHTGGLVNSCLKPFKTV